MAGRFPGGFSLRYFLFNLFTVVLWGNSVVAQELDLQGVDLGQSGDGLGLSLVMRPGNRTTFSFFDGTGTKLKYAEGIGSHVTTVQVEETSTSQTQTALVVLQGVPHIFYFKTSEQALLHLYRIHDVWLRETIDSASNTGGNPSAIACGNLLCVSYYDQNNRNLRFAKGNIGSWVTSTIDASTGDVGSMSDITLGLNGLPIVAYYDSSNKLVKVAIQQTNDSWSVQSLVTPDSHYGIWPDIAVANDGTYHLVMSNEKFLPGETTDDRQLWYAKKVPAGSWTVEAIDWPLVGGYPSLQLENNGAPIILYRFHRLSGMKQSGLFIRRMESGTNNWTWEQIRGTGETFFEYTNLSLQKNNWGDAVLAYRYAAGPNNSSGYRFHGPRDADGDGLPDSREAAYGTSLVDSDSDNDTVVDGEELLVLGTNPKVADSDGDSVLDAFDPDPARSDLGNIVRDGSMNSLVTDAWMPNGLPTVLEKSSIQVAEGIRSLRLQSSSSLAGAEQRNIALAQGATYMVRARYLRRSGSTRMKVSWGNTELNSLADSTSNTWQLYTREITSPGNSGDLRVTILTDGEVFVDDVSVVITEVGFDSDGDGIVNSIDNCPTIPNRFQEDFDHDGIGNACDMTPGVAPDSSSSSASNSSSSNGNIPNPDSALDTDGDGINDAIDGDDDNDGLLDTDEIARATDPKRFDSDQDLVGDGQEITDQTNPRDRGSVHSVLGRTLCSEWNGFIAPLANVFEHINVSSHSLNITASLYDRNGLARNRQTFVLNPGREKDLLIHDLSGRQANAYGRICSAQNRAAGDLDGRMVYYKEDRNSLGSYQFAFALPLSNGITGEQFVTFNTIQPSLNSRDRNNLVANWIQVTNLGDEEGRGRLTFYAQNGITLGSQQIKLKRGARTDFPAHSWGAGRVGLVRWTPDRNTIRFQLRNIRYLYDNPGTSNSFTSAMQLEGQVGNGELQTVFLDTASGLSSVLEVVNTRNLENNILVRIYDDTGQRKYSKRYRFKRYETKHIVVDSLLAGKRGIATVDGARLSSTIAVAMHYARNAQSQIQYVYGVPTIQALGVIFRGSYNTYLGQESLLWLLNPTNAPQAASISLVRSDGTVMLGATFPQTNEGDYSTQADFSVPAFGLKVIRLNNYDGPNRYGVVTVQGQSSNTLVSWVTRQKGNEYVMPTPVR